MQVIALLCVFLSIFTFTLTEVGIIRILWTSGAADFTAHMISLFLFSAALYISLPQIIRGAGIYISNPFK